MTAHYKEIAQCPESPEPTPSWSEINKKVEINWFNAFQMLHYQGEALSDPDEGAAPRYYLDEANALLADIREIGKTEWKF